MPRRPNKRSSTNPLTGVEANREILNGQEDLREARHTTSPIKASYQAGKARARGSLVSKYGPQAMRSTADAMQEDARNIVRAAERVARKGSRSGSHSGSHAGNPSDDSIRSLERRVLSGDLSAVVQLAAAYRRADLITSDQAVEAIGELVSPVNEIDVFRLISSIVLRLHAARPRVFDSETLQAEAARTTRFLATLLTAVEHVESYEDCVRAAAVLVRSNREHEPVEQTLARPDLDEAIDEAFSYYTFSGDDDASMSYGLLVRSLFEVPDSTPRGPNDPFALLHRDLMNGISAAFRAWFHRLRPRVIQDVRAAIRVSEG